MHIHDTIPAKISQLPTVGFEKLKERRARSLRIARIFEEIDFLQEVAPKMFGCGSVMLFRRYEGGALELAHTFFCKQRLCPMCAWRRSLKSFHQLSTIMDFVDKARIARYGAPYAYILITLTLRNTDILDLPETLDLMLESFRTIYRSKKWGDAIKGCHRTLEITYNKETNTFHPHLHLLCAVNPSYFQSSAYISQKAMQAMWKKALRIAYDPIVDIRKVEDTGGAIAETAKYVTKDDDWSLLPDDKAEAVVAALHVALKNRKLYALYGVFRKAFRALHMTDEDGNLINPQETDEQLLREIRQDLKWTLVAYVHGFGGNYQEASIEALPQYWQSIAAVIQSENHEELPHNHPETVSLTEITPDLSYGISDIDEILDF